MRNALRTTICLLLLASGTLFAQEPMALDESCTVSVLNRSVTVGADGAWVLPNVPSNIGLVRARATCVSNGVTRSGQSEYFLVPPNGIVEVAQIQFDTPAPIAAKLTLSAPTTSLGAIGATLQVTATATYANGTSADLSRAVQGTNWFTSNPRVAAISGDGMITAVAPGTVLISAMNEGALAMQMFTIATSGDSDGDGLPDEFERENGLNPTNPSDAAGDLDNDGLSNLDEYRSGTDLRVADTDGDGLNDGREREIGTNALLVDTDGDGIRDGLEVDTGSNPLDPDNYNLARALESIAVTPSAFEIVVNTLVAEASRIVAVTGRLKDGTSINLTARSRGTTYNSSDLAIASFGSVDGQVFGGNAGTATVTVTNGGHSATANVTVRMFAPRAVSFLRMPGFANNVDVAGDYAYVAAGAAGLVVVDVTNRAAPAIVTTLDTPGNANDVKVVAGLAYVADGSAGLHVVDVGTPASPRLIGTVDTHDAWDVAVTGGTAYVADGTAGLRIIDVRNGAAPLIIGTLDTPRAAKGVDVAGRYAVIADATATIVVDIAVPTAPTMTGTAPTSEARDVVVEGTLAYVADFGSTLRVVDFSDPTKPRIAGTPDRNLAGIPTDVAKVREFVFAADVLFVNGVSVTDVRAPATPTVRARLDFPQRDDNGNGIALDHQYVYLTADRGMTENGASGDTALYIGQYLFAEDVQGVAPTVRLTAPTQQPTAVEGGIVRLAATATDDVLVARVDFLVNDAVVGTDTAEPYEFIYRVERGLTTIAIQARATDIAGNSAITPQVIMSVVPDPGTTATGIVSNGGVRVAGARVFCVDRTTTTLADGTFSVGGVPTAAGEIRCAAFWDAPDGRAFNGVSSAVTAIAGGFTNVGTIALRDTTAGSENAPVVSWTCTSSGAMYPPGTAVKLRFSAVGASAQHPVDGVDMLLDDIAPLTVTSLGSGVYETTFTIPADAQDGQTYSVRGIAKTAAGAASDRLTTFSVAVPTIAPITADLTIEATNKTYDGHTVVVRSGTVTIDGPHTFDRLLLLGGRIVHRATDATAVRQLELTVTREVYVACGASFDANGRGYRERRTWPNTTTGGSASLAGGSHGGAGGWWFGNAPAAVYGSPVDPSTPGGAGSDTCCGSGGGVIRVKANAMTVDGAVTANGTNEYTGGAGGSIRLDAATIAGAGEIRADGGISTVQSWSGHTFGWRFHGSGGGGRIALHARQLGIDTTRVTAASPGNTDATRGAAGTVYLRTVDANGQTVSDELILDNRARSTGVATKSLNLGTGTVTAVDGARVDLSAPVPAWVAGSWIEFVDARDEVLAAYEIVASTSTSVNVALPAGETSARVQPGTAYRGYWRFTKIRQRGSAIAIFGPLGAPDLTIIGELETPFVRAARLSLASGVVTHPDAGRLDVLVTDLNVDANSRIDASGRGYQDTSQGVGRTWPSTFTGGSAGAAGGSHGGRGGAWFGDRVGAVYGSVFDPDAPGSAGGRNGDCYGCTAGGGVVRIKATTVTLNGKVLANGRGEYSGGAGGSIRLDAVTLQGSGEIRADGGAAWQQSWTGHSTGWRNHASGGGGRVAVYTQVLAFDRAKISAASVGNTEATRGAAGTVYMTTLDAAGNALSEALILDNRGANTPAPSELVRLGEGTVVSVAGAVVTLSAPVPYGVVGSVVEFLDASTGNRIATYEIVAATSSTITVRLAAGESQANAPAGSRYRGAWNFTSILQQGGATVSYEGLLAGDLLLKGKFTLARLSANNLTLDAATITHVPMGRLELTVAGTFRIPAGSVIDASGLGYQDVVDSTARSWPGDFTHGSRGGSGASHGGLGGAWFGDRVGRTYGSAFDPNTHGAAGGCWGECYGSTAGGGVIRIKAQRLELGGHIRANGNASRTGGAGGSIRIDAGTITGAGEIHADGARSFEQTWTGHSTGWRWHGSGGGGRIALYYDALSLDRAKITAGTSNPTYETRGSAGTIYYKASAQPFGELELDTRVETPQVTILPPIGYGTITDITTAADGTSGVVHDANADLLGPDHLRGVRLFVNGATAVSWPVLSNTAKAMTLDASSAALTAQKGDAYRGLYRFDKLKLRNVKLASHDEIQSTATPDADTRSLIRTNAAPPWFDPDKRALIVVENTATGSFVVAPINAVTDADKPLWVFATNVRSGAATAAVQVAADGSFRIPVTGSPGDTFRVHATDSHLAPASSTVAVNGALP